MSSGEPESEEAIYAKKMKQRNFVINEIIDTERVYCDKLLAVQEVIIEPLQKNGIIDTVEMHGQFGYWTVICGIHKEMLDNMLAAREAGTLKMGVVFHKYSHYMKVYKEYRVNFEVALTRRAALMTSNKRFTDLIESAQNNPRCGGSGIESLLIGPVQRLPRYRLLLTELLKFTPSDHEEFDAVTKSLAKISELASDNNEAIRNRENKEKMMEIMMSIDSRTRINLLDDPCRCLLRSAPLQKQCRWVVGICR